MMGTVTTTAAAERVEYGGLNWSGPTKKARAAGTGRAAVVVRLFPAAPLRGLPCPCLLLLAAVRSRRPRGQAAPRNRTQSVARAVSLRPMTQMVALDRIRG